MYVDRDSSQSKYKVNLGTTLLVINYYKITYLVKIVSLEQSLIIFNTSICYHSHLYD